MVAFRGNFTGGLYSLTIAYCEYVPAEKMPSHYPMAACGGGVSIQNHSRLCTVEVYNYGDRINTVFTVDDVVGDALTHLGNCAWNGGAPPCPNKYSLPEEDAHWDSQASNDVKYLHRDLGVAISRPATALSSVDPELWLAVGENADWFATCLTTPDYPPRDQVWPGLGPQPTP